MAIRILENHPLCKQLEEVFSLMDKFGIQIIPQSDGNMLLRSKEHGEFYLLDLEREFPVIFRGCGVYEIPPALEYKIVRE